MTQRAIEVKIAQLHIVPAVLLLAVPPLILPDVIVDFTVLTWKNEVKEFMHNSFVKQEYIDRSHSYIQIYT